MTTVTGGDFFQAIGRPTPRGLISDPPDYQACVEASESLRLPERTPSVPSLKPRKALSRQQLTSKCKELYAAIKEQALSYLLAIDWRIEDAAAAGEHVTKTEVVHTLNRIKSEQFPKAGEFERYLAEKNWTLADELYLVLRNLLAAKFVARLKREVQQRGGGNQKAIAKLALENDVKWKSRTSCRAGYVAWQCKEYKLFSNIDVPNPPARLLEDLALGR